MTELDPGQRLVLHVDGSYESNGYLGMYGGSSLPRSYLVAGGAAGLMKLMNLMHFGDITTRPELTEEYYAGLFCNEGSYLGTQTACRSMGDEYCEIEVTTATD